MKTAIGIADALLHIGRKRTSPFVYFVLAKSSGRIKIGIASNPHHRLSSLQTGCPEELGLMGFIWSPDAAALERDLHAKFAQHHIRGEWFDCVEEIVDYARDHASRDYDWLAEMLSAIKRGSC